MSSISFAIVGLVAVILVSLGFILYMITTNRIIREQENEIVQLKEQKMKLEKIIRKQKVTSISSNTDIKFGD